GQPAPLINRVGTSRRPDRRPRAGARRDLTVKVSNARTLYALGMRVHPGCLIFVAATVFGASLSDLKLVRVVELRGETHHVQGIDSDGRRLWLTSVDTPGRKGYLQEFSLATGAQLRKV